MNFHRSKPRHEYNPFNISRIEMEFSSTLEVNKKATISLSGFESKLPNWNHTMTIMTKNDEFYM